MRVAIAVPVLAFVAATAAATAEPAVTAERAATCSLRSARDAILASSLPAHWKEEARHVYGPIEGLTRVVCVDFTGDGRQDMAAVFYSGGTAGDVAWVAFRRAGRAWKLELARLHAYKLALKAAGADLVETQPVYRPQDGNCCPTGGYDHVRFHWNGEALVAARRWHTKNF